MNFKAKIPQKWSAFSLQGINNRAYVKFTWLVTAEIHLDQRLWWHLQSFFTIKSLFFLFVLYLLEGSHQVQPTLKRRGVKFHWLKEEYLHMSCGILLQGRFVLSPPSSYLFISQSSRRIGHLLVNFREISSSPTAGKRASMPEFAQVVKAETRDHMEKTRKMLSAACSVLSAVNWLLPQGA